MIRHRSVRDQTVLVVRIGVVFGSLLLTACGRRSTSNEPTTQSSSVTTTTGETMAPATSTASALTTTTAAVITTSDVATTTSTITANWEKFFLPTTSISDRIALLENGASLQQALEVRSKDPLQQQASAKVKAVELSSPDRASVTYDVLLNGSPALTDALGVAVLQDGVWKVTADSFCALISLGATAPIPGCS